MVIDISKELFDSYIIDNRIFKGPHDIVSSTGNGSLDREIMPKYDDENPHISWKILEMFERCRELRYAFSNSSIQTNKNLIQVVTTEIYFFCKAKTCIEYIMENHKDLYESMDKENLENNSFIFINKS